MKTETLEPPNSSEIKLYLGNKPIIDHIKEEKNKKAESFECDICSKAFARKSDLNIHYGFSHKNRRSFACDECSKEFVRMDSLKNHKKIMHQRLFKCKICGKNFTTEKSLKAHWFRHSSKLNYTCETCGQNFVSEHLLWSHKQNSYSGSKCQTMCQICKHQFLRSWDLKEHMFTHHGGMFRCNKCSRCFENRNCLVLHQNMQCSSGIVRPFKCSTCGEKFAEKSKLNVHMVIHSLVELYQCHTCQQTFQSNSDLKTHMLIHGHIKKFVCDFCPASFSKKHSLMMHFRSHGAEKPFSCDTCGKKYKGKESLKSHLLTHFQKKENDLQQTVLYANCRNSYAAMMDEENEEVDVKTELSEIQNEEETKMLSSAENDSSFFLPVKKEPEDATNLINEFEFEDVKVKVEKVDYEINEM